MDKMKSFLTLICLSLYTIIPCAGLTTQLGITTTAAKRIFNIIDTGSSILTIISLIGVVAGVGLLSYGFITAAKAMAKKVGRNLAITW